MTGKLVDTSFNILIHFLLTLSGKTILVLLTKTKAYHLNGT